MREKINEDVLCVLKENELTNQIEVDYVLIENPLLKPISAFVNLCDRPEVALEEIAHFINSTPMLDQLSGHYRYCVYLRGAYQSFNAKNQDTIPEILSRKQLILFNKKLSPEDYNEEEEIEEYKQELKNRYLLWGKAHAINIAYKLCFEDKSVLTFSHRINGWSNPIYQLTPNFSVEIKTNFGYGRASYFYTKLRYKNIDITPFSEWIDYEIALFSEIVRYTQAYNLRNEYWQDAMEFSKDACNLSREDELKFVEKYILEECENMVSGLEGIFLKESFTFKNRESRHYTVDKRGHVLVEFRGEKISGALDFISKILEFDKITSIREFIDRIESCNKRIQPILIEESKIIDRKIAKLNEELNVLRPIYEKLKEESNQYDQMKQNLINEMVLNGQLNPENIDVVRLDKEFNLEYPAYKEFQEEYKRVKESYRVLTEHIRNLTKVNQNIISYNEKINIYFG